jgi:hypothetical protein
MSRKREEWVLGAIIVVISALMGLGVVLISGDGAPADPRPTPTPTVEVQSLMVGGHECWLVSDGQALNQVVCP